jgi:thioredoxin 2
LDGPRSWKNVPVAGDLPLLIFFTRETSGPARRMESLLAHVARKERGRLRVRRVDADEQPQLVRKFAVDEVPSLVLVVDRAVSGRIDGRASMPQIERLLAPHLPEPVVAA